MAQVFTGNKVVLFLMADMFKIHHSGTFGNINNDLLIVPSERNALA